MPRFSGLRLASLALCLAACRPSKPSADPSAADPPARAEEGPEGPAPVVEAPAAEQPEGEPEALAEGSETPSAGKPAEPPEKEAELGCRRTGDERFVYGIGSSSMGSLLGPMLGRQIKERFAEVTFRKWGKSASGLARPDFHDWIAEVPSINSDYDPDVYVVSIGTNDAQPLYSRRYKWVRMNDPRWEELYAERIDTLLDLMAGEDRRRRIIWIGPNAFPKANSRKIGPTIDRLLGERLAAFEGDAHYIPLYDATSPSPGEYIETVTLAGSRKPLRAWTEDGIHLSRFAVRALMIDPALELLAACFDPA